MRFSGLTAACAGVLLAGSGAMAQTAEPEGPRLIGRGAAMSSMERVVYQVKEELCPAPLREQLMGGAMSDHDWIIVAVIVGVAVLVVVLIAAD